MLRTVSSSWWMAVALAPALAAQCGNGWLPGDGLLSTNGVVMTTARWDPDGAGPATPRLVVAGDFRFAGDIAANRLAAFDPATGLWSAFGSGLNGLVRAVASLANGELVVGGDFTTAGGVAVSYLARWDGSAWQGLGAGTDFPVYSLAVANNGDVFAGGRFHTAGGVPAENIARWNGNAWSALATGVQQGLFTGVYALLPMANGDLFAGGDFTQAGGIPANNIARWNGTVWSALGSGVDGAVLALAMRPNGDVVVGGNLLHAGGTYTQYNARWDGAAWLSMPWHGSPVLALATRANGDLAIATAAGIAVWNGASLTAEPDAPNGAIKTVGTMPNDDLVVGGQFYYCGNRRIPNLARRASVGWQPLSVGGLDGGVDAVAVLPNGDLVAGGTFAFAGGVPIPYLARRVGGVWQSLGSGVNGPVRALLVMPNGDLVAGGYFTTAGGTAANAIARWNGTSWSSLGTGLTSTGFPGTAACWALMALANGDLVVGGFFQFAGSAPANEVARWNGSSWSALGNGLSGDTFFFPNGVTSLAQIGNGDLVAGGAFTTVDGVFVGSTTVARWNGANWSSLFAPQGQVLSLATLANGDLVAGVFNSFFNSSVATWNGSVWSPLGSLPIGTARAMVRLPGGDLLVGGDTFGQRLQRWDGSVWSTPASEPDSPVQALTIAPNGDVVAGGWFQSVAGMPSAYVAELTTSCPATATSFGPGCFGSGGANALVATSLPWIGASVSARATGMPANGIVCRVLGFGTVSVPLPQVFTQGTVGCSWLVTPDLLDLYLPVAGQLDTTLPIPLAMSLVGVEVHEQALAFDFGSTPSLVGVTGSNGVTFAIGAF